MTGRPGPGAAAEVRLVDLASHRRIDFEGHWMPGRNTTDMGHLEGR
ncbi:MAG: hypothetical protein KA778_17875 [Burkholderiaceae bacterium]|nr:hypothetical protein [Burkholderiaceae bacterium]